MSGEEKDNEHDIQKEKEEIERMGVSNTWNLLTDSKKEKKNVEKREFKGFQ